MAIATNKKKKFSKIPPDKVTDYKLEFDDQKIIDITNHDLLLSEILPSMLEGVTSGTPFRLEGYSSTAFELIHSVISVIKKKDKRLYIKYLNNDKIRGNMKSEYSSIFKDYESSNVIEAANLSSHLKMDLPKRVLVWYIAEYIRNNTHTVEDITKFLGATPLDEETCVANGLDESHFLWEGYPDEFQNVFGKLYIKPSSSNSA